MSSVPPAPPPPPSSGDPRDRSPWASDDANPLPPSESKSPSPPEPPSELLIDSDQETLGGDQAAAEPTGARSATAGPPASHAKPGGRDNRISDRPAKSIPPPPPPPRATLPPTRPIAEVSVPRSGIGSAVTRWRGSLPEITPVAADADDSNSSIAAADQEDPTAEVTRSAPSWLLSLVIHLIVLLVLALITSPPGNGFTHLVLDFGISNDAVEDALDLDLSTPLTEDLIEAPEDALDDTLVESEIPEIFEMVQPAEMEAIEPVLLGAEPIEISKPMFSGRTGAMRKALMAMYGGTEETANAVKLGLAWLKRQQNRSGYWSMVRPYSNGAVSENRTAATAMALLAFAGDGNTHLEGPYRVEVEKGVKYLVSQQDRGGFMAGSARGNERTYAQAQATIALCELYGMTKDSWLRAYAQRAVDYALKAQASDGGWRYRPNEPGDTSVTGWYVMALQSARGAGLEVDQGQMNRISNYLDAASVYYGSGYAYQPGRSDATPTMTAEGLLCRQYLGWERNHGPLQDGLKLLRADAPFDINRQNVYYWYYATQVFHHVGGPLWTEWNDQMKVKLPALQIKDGSERGSWAPQGDRWSIGGRLYTTCLSIYCLEVYYRHLPLYDQQ
ncbi:prenyltransferase/squalene oxidase repeat-containing protein [Stieleria mannarensis]|uniref:prenyltransferase/squalene oxidase repeat-containing protein n=1 Tax=Stieleria mannarensis TaxID=2755585 RepID=UPI0025700043|nr:prenyltransferase/squalene oxidase repeat-containing protein [Rhodopirellula sp. JC639]